MTISNSNWSRRLLMVDCIFLIGAGLAGLVMDMASHVAGRGPFGEIFFRNPLVIGVIEAHGLAVLASLGVLFAPASKRFSRHLQLAVVHVLLGGSNIAFFGVFRLSGGEVPGIVVTVIHFAFIAANLAALIPVRHRKVARPLLITDARAGG